MPFSSLARTLAAALSGSGVRRALLPLLGVLSLASPALAAGGGDGGTPHWLASMPFVLILLCIAILPLIHKTEHWWHKNQNKLLVSTVLGLITLGYYYFVRMFHGAESGLESIGGVLHHAVVAEYIPFIVLLFSLYTIAGGIELRGDLKARPLTNTIFIAVGTAIASFVGTTGAAMLLIRPLLRTNKERRHVVHTVVFFIFAVCNCGGLLLPIGDPPLFLGYLRGVPFTWTMQLLPEFLIVNGALLVIYYIWDTRAHGKEEAQDVVRDETQVEPLSIKGGLNFVLLLGVVLCVALLDPSKPVPGTEWTPPPFLREGLQLVLAAMSFFVPIFTPKGLRERVSFDFFAIAEVACLFIGIFITMQVPLEVLNNPDVVEKLGVDTPMKFFWFTGILSSFLDNAPTYVVFFETAKGVPPIDPSAVLALPNDAAICDLFLKAISCGAVFMGANTYIGNGPNFLVKAIAEQAGIKMPSFFGYMKYSVAILIPLMVVVGCIFFIVG
jgi:Na+/H+ antiporter NhaD/arsenite permease-like protein